ncbi:hypothetical protein [uncultured Aquimarina sp.]|uniref:hypothetical protein n=1 Tax=uncultured Aquimarina sp. TaxID=575652 RepID=UPI00260EC024|nr:hypothetical protein [uncultured Aquimarina sp.]
MNLYFDKAVNYIAIEIGKDFGIILGSIQDLEDFYAFTYQSRKYLETGKIEDMAIGQGYNFISKSDQRVFSFGSRYVYSDALKELRNKVSQEAEIRKKISHFDIQKKFDLSVSSVIKKQILVDTLLKFGLTYTIPEVVGKLIFRIPKNYKKKFLFEKLTELPITFHGLDQNELSSLIIELIKNNSCEFDILEQKENNLARYIDKATKVDLEPIW